MAVQRTINLKIQQNIYLTLLSWRLISYTKVGGGLHDKIYLVK